jgi:hypothetical protein
MTPMTPERKTAIARTNGAKSRGPKTPEGKAVSSMNALRHGLTASRPLLPGESQESFEELLKEYMEEYEPDGPAERDLVHRMVVSKWREQRAWTVETAALRGHMPGSAQEDPTVPDPAASLTAAFTSYTGNSRFLDCFYRQENAVTRRFDRALDRLLELQERRHAITPREIRVTWVDPPGYAPPTPSADINLVS